MSLLVRAAVASHDASQHYITVLHYTTEDGSISVADCAANFAGAITDGLRATLTTGGLLDSVTVVEILPHGDLTPPNEATQVLNLAGTYGPGGFTLPQAICGLVDLHSSVAGRGTHGWSYGFPALDDGQLDSGQKAFVSSGLYWEALQDHAEGCAADIIVGSSHVTPVVFSRARWLREEANYFFGITAAVPSAKVRWLRKRSTI